jgi:hypothetical protein
VNAPTWLTTLVATLMVLVATYSVWRLAVARLWERATDYESDILNLAIGVAGAGLVASWAHTLPRPVWTAVFAVGGVYFAARTCLARSDRTVRGRLLAHTACCAIVVYMFLAGVAPTTINGSTAGQFTMAGEPGMILDQTITFPAIGLIFVVGLCFYAVTVVNRIEPLRVESAAAAELEDLDEGFGSMDGTGGGIGLMLAPRSVEVCRIVIALVLTYAILTKLV